ncbi:Basic-leucine zipper transcription factor [Heracleum sosnowskyi]|uniref:Basic-leucine zipper transcription factor n=1 Tax=Heracleum sosnowskyi TaxID=360622 RepID=A0AAD8GSX9_9APIA|nr:Basic-leucine zipper transcription factor [Heracleum sosnowskyi]
MGSLQPRSLLRSNLPPASSEQETKLFSAQTHQSEASTLMSDSLNKNHVSDRHHEEFHHQIPYGHVMNNIQLNASSSTHNPASSSNFIGKDGGGAYNDLGEFDQALFLYLDGQSPNSSSSLQQHRSDAGMRPATLNIFPSQPMHVEPSSSTKVTGMGLVNPSNGVGSKRPLSETSIVSSDQKTSVFNVTGPSPSEPPPPKVVKQEGNSSRGATNLEHDRPRTPDAKTLRRLAQNREAARKSRLRKKAYIQQLESSRVKLAQLEQEIQKSARAQGYATAGSSLVGEQGSLPLGIGNLSPDAVVFDVEYARWLEEHQRLMFELRAATQEHMGENELRLYVENCLSHFNELMNLKCMIAKTDVFHLLSGTWKTPAERCFMWIAGFRPSNILKMIPNQIEALSEQQLMGIYGLTQSTMESEEVLSQGLDALNQSISDVIVSDSMITPANMANYMGQMALAMGKLSTLEGFVRQADCLRQQTIHRLHQLLTTRQSAQGLLAIAEYFHRLRTLSSLWLARPRHD